MGTQTFEEAVLVIVREARSERRHTNASVGRIVRALKTLSVRGESQRKVLRWFDVLRDDGTPYRKDLKVVWDTE